MPGKAFAPDGSPTDDPGAALKGAFTVWGGHKGSGLAMMVQLLGMMAGGAAAPPPQTDCSLLIVVIDPGILGSAEEFQQRVAGYADSVRATRPLDPALPVRVPFDRSNAERNKRIAADAIEVPDSVIQALRAAATPA